MVVYLINSEECFEKGLLKKISPSKELAKKSLEQARFFIAEAEDLLKLNKKQICVISLYNSYFHASRALLFKDGIKERSHYCIARYIEEAYTTKKLVNIQFLNAFENMMSMRHNVQYSTEKVEIDEDLIELINICLEFIETINRLIK